MEEAVKSVAWKVSGSYGPGGTDSESLQGWILKFRGDSKRLCTSVETLVDWLSNGIPSWAVYCEFMSGCLIALDKQPCVSPFGVRETWRRLFTNIVLKVTVLEATMVCQDNHLCYGLKAVTDGAVHGIQYIWDENSTSEDWGFFIVDAMNAFNKINQVRILWTVQHNLKWEITYITQPWYAENNGDLGTFPRIDTYFSLLTHQGPVGGFTPNCPKAYWLCIRRIPMPEKYLTHVTCWRCARARVISRVTSGMTSPRATGWEIVRWLRRRTLVRLEKPRGNIPSRVMPRWYLRSNQSGYSFNASPEAQGMNFWGWRRCFGKTVCLVFSSVRQKPLSPIIGAIITMRVKKYGLGLLNPVTSAKDKYLSCQRGSA